MYTVRKESERTRGRERATFVSSHPSERTLSTGAGLSVRPSVPLSDMDGRRAEKGSSRDGQQLAEARKMFSEKRDFLSIGRAGLHVATLLPISCAFIYPTYYRTHRLWRRSAPKTSCLSFSHSAAKGKRKRCFLQFQPLARLPHCWPCVFRSKPFWFAFRSYSLHCGRTKGAC